MSVNLDASGIGQLALRLGVVSDDQARECLIELEDKKAPAADTVRLMERTGYLRPWHGRKKREPDEALRYMEECAQGLAYSHARGLTHRDIKPTNILIDATSGQAKLVDYGLAEISLGSAVHLQRQDDRDDDVAVDR